MPRVALFVGRTVRVGCGWDDAPGTSGKEGNVGGEGR